MLGRLAVACQMAWDKERGIDTKDRVSKSLLFRGTKAGKEAIDLCQASGIEVPVSLWLAYGELSLSMIKYADASLALSKVLEAESSNARAYVMWACARLGLSKALDENKTLPFLKRAKAMKVPDGRLLPEVAGIYTYLSEKACLEGDKSRAESYRSEAIDCIRKSIEQAPGYKGMTIRMIPFWYNWLNDDARFQELVTE